MIRTFEAKLEEFRKRDFKRTLRSIEKRRAQERKDRREQAKTAKREARRLRDEARRAEALAKAPEVPPAAIDEATAVRRAKKNLLMKKLRAKQEAERRDLLDIRNLWRSSVKREAAVACGWPSVSMTWLVCFKAVKQWRDA